MSGVSFVDPGRWFVRRGRAAARRVPRGWRRIGRGDIGVMKGREMRCFGIRRDLLCSAAVRRRAGGAAAPPDEAALKKSLDRVVARGGARRGPARPRRQPHDPARERLHGHGRTRSRQPGDRFRIGSVTKSFVPAVVLQLVGEEKLKLDDTVAHLRRGCCVAAGGLPCASFCSRRAVCRLPGDPRIFRPYLKGNAGYAWTPSRLLAIANSHNPSFRRVRVGVLEHELPRARSDRRRGNAAHARARAEAARFRPGRPPLDDVRHPADDPGQHIHGYFPLNGRLTDPSVLSPTAGWAAGAIVSTAGDVARFYRALLQGPS